jgi:hypothetical protein
MSKLVDVKYEDFSGNDLSNNLAHNYTVKIPVILEFIVDWFDDERIDYYNDGAIVVNKDGSIQIQPGLFFGIFDMQMRNLESARGDIMWSLNRITQTGEAQAIEGPDLKETLEIAQADGER